MTHTEFAFAVILAFAACGAIFWIGLVLFLAGAHEPTQMSTPTPPNTVTPVRSDDLFITSGGKGYIFPCGADQESVLRRLHDDARQRAQRKEIEIR